MQYFRKNKTPKREVEISTYSFHKISTYMICLGYTASS